MTRSLLGVGHQNISQWGLSTSGKLVSSVGGWGVCIAIFGTIRDRSKFTTPTPLQWPPLPPAHDSRPRLELEHATLRTAFDF